MNQRNNQISDLPHLCLKGGCLILVNTQYLHPYTSMLCTALPAARNAQGKHEQEAWEM